MFIGIKRLVFENYTKGFIMEKQIKKIRDTIKLNLVFKYQIYLLDD